MITLVSATSLSINDRMAAAVSICVFSEGWDDRTVEDLNNWILNPVSMGNAVFLMDGDEAVAIAVFANITDEQVAKMVNCIAPTVREWNAGTALWITDLAALPGYGAKMAKKLKEDWFDHEAQPVFWWRAKKHEIGSYMPERRH